MRTFTFRSAHKSDGQFVHIVIAATLAEACFLLASQRMEEHVGKEIDAAVESQGVNRSVVETHAIARAMVGYAMREFSEEEAPACLPSHVVAINKPVQMDA